MSEIPHSFYLWIQKKLASHADHDLIILKKEAISFLHTYKIPKTLRPVIIKEMEDLAMIRTINVSKIKIINLDKNYIEDNSKLYHKVGFY